MRALLTLNPLIWRYKIHLCAGILFIFLTNIFAVYAPEVIGEGINSLIEANEVAVLGEFGETALPVPSTMAGWGESEPVVPESKQDVYDYLAWIGLMQAGIYILAYLLKGVFSFCTRQTIIVMSRLVEYDLKKNIFDQYLKLDAHFYRANDTGDLMNRISEDVSKVRMYLGPAVMYTLNLLALMSLTIGVMLYIDVRLTLVVLLPLPLMSFAVYRVSRLINRQSERLQAQQSRISSFVQQHIAGIRILKAFRKESFARDLFDQEADHYKIRALRLVKTEALFMPIIVLLVGLSTILTIYVGGRRVMSGDLQVGDIFQFVFYVNLLTWPFASVGWVTSLVQKAEASMQRVNDFLEAEPTVTSIARIADANADGAAAAGAALDVAASTLRFENVGFTYEETGIRALDGISFSLTPGRTVAITGRTGSGKSTITQLAMRTFDPTSGRIFLGETPLTEAPLTDYRALTGYVPQDVFLFSDTIANNIAFGVDDTSPEDIAHAARAAHVAHNIEDFPNGYDTVLGERGVNLSGGQKQRLSIARALLSKPRFLILDDCLSAVDVETENHILAAIAEQARSSAILIVSHRVSSIRHADEIVVLDKGKVVERGTHESLYHQGGVYAKMVDQQAAE